jgi:alkanesulfonate monooxygenase SsuD/methylene tetrahydromethanopterin reductase-like flavin-dependent oxidoreductase (luciferase family)
VDQLPELAFYGLAGAPRSPADLLTECRDGEALGLGSVFLSERFNIKEAVTLSGAAAACTQTLGITTGVTNHNTRHPVVTASYATTMHRLTGGRFALGHCPVTGGLHKGGELGVGHFMGVDPEPLDRDRARRAFFRILRIIAHHEAAAWHPDHPVIGQAGAGFAGWRRRLRAG